MKYKETIRIILSTIKPGEKILLREILERLNKRGYKITMPELKMFIRYHMLHKYLGRKYFRGKYYYYLIYGK